MRNLLTFTWWLALLAALEPMTFILDSCHHLIWGKLGLVLLKFSYFAFATILFLRFLSFRSQKNFESMVESYNRLTTAPWFVQESRFAAWLNFLIYIEFIAITLVDLVIVFCWNENTFRVAILLDFGVWVLTLRWIYRVHWLKARGDRERIKEALDNARSRLHSQLPGTVGEMKEAAKWPYVLLCGMSIVLIAWLSRERWLESRKTYRVGELKACLQQCIGSKLRRYYHQGELDRMLSEGCLEARKGQVKVDLRYRQGELYLHAEEMPAADYFANGIPGDEGLLIDEDGRFKWVGVHSD